MKFSHQNLLSILGVLCFGISQGFAEAPNDTYDKPAPCVKTTPCDKPASCDKPAPCVKTTPCVRVCVPPGQYVEPCGPSVYGSASYTLWTAREEGLAVAVSGYNSSVKGSVFYPENKLRSGFQVALGTFLPHDGWDANVEYTWFSNTSNKIKDLGVPANTTISLWSVNPATLLSTLSSASARWKNYFNRIDAQLARSFYAGHYLNLRPFLGLIGAWDKQRFDINYVASGQTAPNTWRSKQNWWGVGPYAGLDNTFTFYSDCGNQWSLFIDTGAALAWGTFSTKQTLSDPSQVALLNFGNSLSNVSPMLELALGLRWEAWWADNSWMFFLQAGWQLQAWFNHNQLSTSATNGGLFSLQGFTLKAQIGF